MLTVFAAVPLVLEDGAIDLVVHPLANGAVPIAIGVAVLRYRLFEIDRIISRGASYAPVTLVLVAIYGTLVVGVGSALRGLSGASGGDLLAAAST